MLALEHPAIGWWAVYQHPYALTYFCCIVLPSFAHVSISWHALWFPRIHQQHHVFWAQKGQRSIIICIFFSLFFFGYLLYTYVSSFESWMKTLLQVTWVCHTMFCNQITHPHQYKQDGGINPHTFKISVVIFHTVSHSILLRCQFWEFCVESVNNPLIDV